MKVCTVKKGFTPIHTSLNEKVGKQLGKGLLYPFLRRTYKYKVLTLSESNS